MDWPLFYWLKEYECLLKPCVAAVVDLWHKVNRAALCPTRPTLLTLGADAMPCEPHHAGGDALIDPL